MPAATLNCLTSDDLNYLIFRYLVEAGYSHSAFAFGNESLAKDFRAGDEFGPGALVDVVQKGLQYKELEARLGVGNESVPPEALSAAKLLRAKAPQELFRAPLAGPVATQDLVNTRAVKCQGHTGEVNALAWSPSGDVLASASSDSTARLWRLHPQGSQTTYACDILQHRASDVDSVRDVISLSWSPDGQYVATGSYDGVARIWGRNGYLFQCLTGHGESVYVVRYSPSGAHLVTGSLDSTVVVWDTASGKQLKQLKSHSGSVLDVCWLNATTFASCSTDEAVHVFKLQAAGEKSGKEAGFKAGQVAAADAVRGCEWLRTLGGHAGDVNTIHASPCGQLLASGGDDKRVKLWRLTQEQLLHDLVDPALPGPDGGCAHKAQVQRCRFRPAGPGSANPSLALQLATVALDGAVKLWAADTGELVHVLSQHAKAVNAVAWAPSGRLLASGGLDRQVCVWDASSGRCIEAWTVAADINDLAWRPEDGVQLAVALSDGSVDIVDVKQ